jgi:uncharacterized protein (TIGR02145 family)
MRRIIFILFGLTFSVTAVLSQTPQAFKYQAAARDAAGSLLNNQDVSFQISILEGGMSGPVVYTETFDTTTNSFGLVNLEIGNGSPIVGDFSTINWATNTYFLKVEMDELGGSNYLLLGTTQLLSVPYALHSETTADTTRWRKNGNDLFYSNGNVAIGTDNAAAKLDVRGSDPNDGVIFQIGNSDQSHKVTIFGGRQFDPNPFIQWKEGDPLRFATDEDFFSEKMRVTSMGQLAIGTETPDTSALLDLSSYNKGFLLPRMTSAQISNIPNPANGLQVYNTDEDKLYIFVTSQGAWKEISFGSGSLPTTADYTIGSGSSCSGTIVNGDYNQNISLSSEEYVTIEINAASVGNYVISTDTVNGYSFSGSGTFTSTGTQTIDLMGTGSPLAEQSDNFTATASNDGGSCTFTVDVEQFVWQCGDTIIDSRDGKSYKTVFIGMQCWMAENLDVGNRIDVSNNQTNNSILEKYCYNNLDTNCDSLGGLYQWDEIMQYSTAEGIQGICPTNWHIPTDEEWKMLEGAVDSQYGYPDPEWEILGFRGSDVGLNLKAATSWNGSGNGNDSFGFSALASGYGDPTGGTFSLIGDFSVIWSSSQVTGTDAYYRGLTFDSNQSNRSAATKTLGGSVRCLKNTLAVNTGSILNATQSTLDIEGEITELGGYEVLQHGHCWSTSSNPTISDSKTELGSTSSTGTYVSSLSGLSSGTTYYVRAYATNGDGTVYGNEVEYTTIQSCPGTPTVSYESQVYNTILIGSQCWLKENLNVGNMIDGSLTMTDNGIKEKYCYDNLPNNCDTYGGLYRWDEMMQYMTTEGAQGLCPPGWHIPTDEEWKELEGTVDSQYGYPDPEWNSLGLRGFDASVNIRSTSGWFNNGNGSDIYGFSALPGGFYYFASGSFDELLTTLVFWTSTQVDATYAIDRELYFNTDQIVRNETWKNLGASVRCLQD